MGAVWDEKERGFHLSLVGPVMFEQSGLVLGVVRPKSRGESGKLKPRSGLEGGEAERLDKEIKQRGLKSRMRWREPIW
jgi:hypothetical protein